LDFESKNLFFRPKARLEFGHKLTNYTSSIGSTLFHKRENEIDMLNWIQCIPFDETRGYVSRVLAAITMYEGILRGGSLTLDSLDQEFLFSAD